jgi:hypothetical protein
MELNITVGVLTLVLGVRNMFDGKEQIPGVFPEEKHEQD